MHDGAHIVAGGLLHHLAEHVEAFSLPFGERVFLAHRPQMDAFFEVVHVVEVLAPALVYDSQHHFALHGGELLGSYLFQPLSVVLAGVFHECLLQLWDAHGLMEVSFFQFRGPERLDFRVEAGGVPLG